MNELFDFEPLGQTPDSTQTESGSSFMEMNKPVFTEQQTSIMSAGFKNESLDSLVKVKTKRLRVRKKKVIKSYQYVDSYLIVKKDSFAFLQNIQNPSFLSFDPHQYILNSSPQSDSIIIVNANDAAIDVVNEKTNEVIPLGEQYLVTDSGQERMADSLWINAKEDFVNVYNAPVISEYKQVLDISKNEDQIVVNEDSVKENIVEEIVTINSPLSPSPISGKPVLSSEIWLMGLLLALLFLMAFIKFQFNAKLKTYLQSVFSYQSFYKMFKEQNATNRRLAILMSTVYFLNVSLVAYYTFMHFHSFQNGLNHHFTFPRIFAALLLGYFLFTIFNKIIAFVFESYALVNENIYNLFFSNRILGLSLLPLVVLYPYIPQNLSKYVLFLLWGLVAGSFILRWFRGLKISFKHKVPYSYMFLYLCTLEIIPIIIIIKTLLE